MRTDLAVFGYVGSGLGKATRVLLADFAERLGRAVALEIAVFEATSYADLSKAVASGYADLAWLPPIPLMSLDGQSAIRPIVAHRRSDGFHSALVVAAGSRFVEPSDLEGVRAAWVDRDSASGYVLARIALARAGIDPARAFVEE